MKLYNTLTRNKEAFVPQNPSRVTVYACGPTVYARPHIGNARSAVGYDILFRVLQATYGAEHVVYVRNITDVDDKTNLAATQRGMSIGALTQEVTAQFHDDMRALGVLAPTIEPRVTDHIRQIIALIERLIASGNAYEAQGHVLFDVLAPSAAQGWRYGMLSGRSQEEMLAGARVEVAPYKKNAGDFVLWKPASAQDDPSSRFASPWGEGRPGWHIECSAMSLEHLGTTFDIHGGGADLMFPHHENEIAQSCNAHPQGKYARVWVHNGFLTVNGEKMSKSLGNFITVHELLQDGVRGEVIRMALLSTHYRKPLDWNAKLVEDSRKQLDSLYRTIASTAQEPQPDPRLLKIVADDMNVPEAIAFLHHGVPPSRLQASAQVLGLLGATPNAWFQAGVDADEIEALIAQRTLARTQRQWAESDRIRDILKARGVVLEDKADGTTLWRVE